MTQTELLPADWQRIAKQRAAVLGFMSDAGWHTLREVSEATGAPESSASAALRSLRQRKHGGYAVLKRRLYPGSGTWEYHVVPQGGGC